MKLSFLARILWLVKKTLLHKFICCISSVELPLTDAFGDRWSTLIRFYYMLFLQATPSKTDTFWTVLERCSFYRESNKGSKERRRPTLGVRFREVSVL